MKMKVALLALVWLANAAAAGAAEKRVRPKQRVLSLSDLFIIDKKKESDRYDNSADEMDADGEEVGTYHDYNDYYYYNYYDDQYPIPKKSMKSVGKMGQNRAMGKGGYHYGSGLENGKGKSKGKGKGKGKGSSYYGYYDDPTHAPEMWSTYHPTPSPPPYYYEYPEPPRYGKKGMMGKKGGKGSKYYYDDYYYYDKTKYPLTKPPSHPTGSPPSNMPPATTPTAAPRPTPQVPTPSPPVTGRPTRAPADPMDPNGQDTSPPTTRPVGGPAVIELTAFSIEYDIAPLVIPPLTDVEAVEAATATFLRDFFGDEVPGLENLVVDSVGEDLSFPFYTIDYEIVATVTDGTTKEELDAIATMAFQGASLQEYVEIIQALPTDNSFSRVTGVRKIATPENRDADLPVGEGGGGLADDLPMPLLVAAGAASFALIGLGIALNRREKATLRKNRGGKGGGDGVTVAGDTYAGDTFDGTLCSQSPSRGGGGGGGGDGNRSVLSGATYESAVRRIYSDEASSGYGSDSDAGSKYYEKEEEKEEIGPMDQDTRSVDGARFQAYGGVLPVGVHDPYMNAIHENRGHGDGDSAGSMHSSIRSGASGEKNHGSDHSRPVSTDSSGDTSIHLLDSTHSRPLSTDSADTSIHILEDVSSDDDDLKHAESARQMYRSYYNSKTPLVHIPSVERNDYDNADAVPVTGRQDSSQRSQRSVGSRASHRSSGSQRSGTGSRASRTQSARHSSSSGRGRGPSSTVDPPEENVGSGDYYYNDDDDDEDDEGSYNYQDFPNDTASSPPRNVQAPFRSFASITSQLGADLKRELSSSSSHRPGDVNINNDDDNKGDPSTRSVSSSHSRDRGKPNIALLISKFN